MAMNQLNLPALDRAHQVKQANAFNMERAKVGAQREDAAYDDEQRMANTRFLYGATKVLQDIYQKDPDQFYVAADELGSEGIRRGIIDPDAWDPQAITIEKVQEMNNAALVGLGGQPEQQRKVGKTWINPDTQTMWSYINGVPTDSGVPAQQYAMRPVDTAEGVVPFDPTRGSPVGGVIPGTDPASMREREVADVSATKQAETDVKAREEYLQLQQSNRSAYNAYEVARNGLMAGLERANTGYFAGKVPPITEGAQIAEGGVAAMAPVLKQLFRASGEGIFTDKDQELLMSMVPTRDDLPEARLIKMELIDRLVRSKLQMDDLETLQKARNAIEKGANPEEVKKRLQGMGIDPRKL